MPDLKTILEEQKRVLMSAWRQVYHASVSGSPEEQKEAEEWAKKKEQEFLAKIEGMMKAKKVHLLKTKDVTFCGWGSESGVEVQEIPEDATCKSCIRLANMKGKK